MTGSLKRIISAITRWRRIRLVAEVVGAVVLLSAGVSAGSVVASSTAPAATIHGCVNTKTGALSVKLKAGAKCPRRTKSLSWSSGAAFGSRTNTAVANTSSGATCTLGEALLMPGKTLGDNTIPANGQLLSINQFTALFSLYGTKYGGNGTTNFAVPNLKQAAPDGLTYAICLAGVFP
jgi:Phage Tail Collar Domain